MIRWLLWFWFKAHTGVNRISAPLLPSEEPWFHTALVEKEGRLLLLELFSSSHRTFSVPYTNCGSPDLFCVVTFGLWATGRELKILYMHTPIPWVFTFMSFITAPPAPEFKMKHLKFDQGCVLMSAWVMSVPCFLKWFLPFYLPLEKKTNQINCFL